MYGKDNIKVGDILLLTCKIFVPYSAIANTKTASKHKRGFLTPKNTANIPIQPLPKLMLGVYAPSLKTKVFPAQLAKKPAKVQQTTLYLLHETPCKYKTSSYFPTYFNLVPQLVYFKNKYIINVSKHAIMQGKNEALDVICELFRNSENAIV